MTDVSDHLASLIEPVARELLGEPNRAMSSKKELRFGSRGSLSIDLEKGTWFDHEAGEGGGTLDLITRATGRTEHARMEWLEQHGYALPETTNSNGANGRGNAATLGPIVATYDYVDEDGGFLFQVTRHDPKDFRQRTRDIAGQWTWSVKGVRQVPYRLPELIEAVANEHIAFIVEGEKDADNLTQLGAPATTNAGGAGKWPPSLNQFFVGADVVIVADNDEQSKNKKTGQLLFHPDGRPRFAGQDHAHTVAAALSTIALRVRLLDLGRHWPACPPKGDISDWIAHGGTIDQLYDIIERLPNWSPEQVASTGRPPIKILSKAEFIKGFQPPDYLVDGILQRRFLYAVTGQTGHAKTAVALLIAELVASSDYNAMLGTHRVEKGRVIYFVGENPDDVRMRVIGSDSNRTDNAGADNISFIPGVFNIDEMWSTIEADIRQNGDASLIVIDTSAAYFLGNEELSNTQMGGYARTQRRLTTLTGQPCVLVLCHPIKHVTEQSQLLPRGGGAYLAEVDGNLTLWRISDDVVELHYNKMRGPGFQAMSFKLETIRSQKLVDQKGRQIKTVRAVAISQREEDQHESRAEEEEDCVLAAMLKLNGENGGSFSSWANEIGWTTESGEAYKKKVERIVLSLEKKKPRLTVKIRNRWCLTEEGKEVARQAVLRFNRRQEADSQQTLL
jgi:AAA domain